MWKVKWSFPVNQYKRQRMLLLSNWKHCFCSYDSKKKQMELPLTPLPSLSCQHFLPSLPHFQLLKAASTLLV